MFRKQGTTHYKDQERDLFWSPSLKIALDPCKSLVNKIIFLEEITNKPKNERKKIRDKIRNKIVIIIAYSQHVQKSSFLFLLYCAIYCK